ncbi:Oligosaccharide translocation protein rft1 [Grifola frondosa]|uniref:Man(5)GlcNAc(2)-PP-dolichol translocation protein RFT1 n=1 Tax=Grifola frondosa TaxID=5627 RepID=A0A1C7M2A0_GRIFR|nr:Oligosaccharide translocation protein rft1 [Grifola frondosa]
MDLPPPPLLSAALASASSLVLLQLFSRIFTFVLNQALVRLVSPQVFGTAAIQFELLLSTILFLSREGVRNALLRAPPSDASSKISAGDKSTANAKALVTNISLLPVLLGVPIAFFSALLYLTAGSITTASQPYFHASVAIYVLAAFFELLSEPLYIRAQNELRFDIRVKAEGMAVVLKTLTAFVVLVTAPAEYALFAFALGQAAYGLTMLLAYLRVYRRSIDYWPKKVVTAVHGNTKTMYFDPALFHLAVAMSGQSVVKHFLTEGDKFLVSRLSPLADQGGYAIASNYGSLVARIVFQPIEETSRVFFSKTLSSSSEKDQQSLRTASNILQTLLLLFTHLFLVLATFAPPYFPLALALFLPPRYLDTSAPTILRTYIYYIPAMAFNGVLEAFFASTASTADLRSQSRWLLACSLAFVGAAVVFARALALGDAGLVWANVANMLLRAAYAWHFACRFFRERGGRQLLGVRMVVPPVGVLDGPYSYWSIVRSRVPRVACFIFERATFTHLFVSLRK